MQSCLSENIISTIVYYDVMDYPLTSFEIWKYLISQKKEEESRCSLAEVVEKLDSDGMKKHIESFYGFYFIRGRKNLVDLRLERNKISEAKRKKISRTVRFLKYIPYVKMVSIAGRVAMKNAERSSDIDLVIAFKKRHIFTGRFLTFLMMEILGKRRKGLKIRDKICLNHFLSDEYLISIRDLFSSHEYCFMHPIYKFSGYKKFLKKNRWIFGYRPNFRNDIPPLSEIRDSKFSRSFRKIAEKIFSFPSVEKYLKNIQVEKIEKNPKTKNVGGVIIYTDDELAFWPDFEKQGPRIYDKFKSKLAELGIEN